MDKKSKIRIDQLLVARNLASSHAQAQAIILSGKVIVNDQRVEKASETFFEEDLIRIKGLTHPFVSRGGVKLQAALEYFKICPAKKICLDIGASTGGFTDCLLQNGAAKVYAFDVGNNQLHYKLRLDSRVIVRENFNVRYITEKDIPEKIDLIVIDVSFISLKLIIPPVIQAVLAPWQMLALVKPQFEADKGQVGPGGIVRDIKLQKTILEEIKNFMQMHNLKLLGTQMASIKGEKGNQEYVMGLSRKSILEVVSEKNRSAL